MIETMCIHGGIHEVLIAFAILAGSLSVFDCDMHGPHRGHWPTDIVDVPRLCRLELFLTRF